MQGVLQKLNAAIRQIVNPTLIASSAVLALAVGLGAQSEQPPKDKTAGQYYKNIKVLNDIPASDLLPGMRYITTALGVKCDYCHVKDNFPSDDKRPKQTAREMITMLNAINANNFSGRPEVSCYTCHQGHHEPMGLPALPAEATQPEFSRLAAGAPTLTAVLDKFAQAIGGDAANKIQTREIQGQETANGNTLTIDRHLKGPDQMYAEITTPRGPMTAGFDGSRGWIAGPHGVAPINGEQEIIWSRDAQINPSAAIANYKPKRLFGTAKVGDADAYVVFATAPDGSTELGFFDQQSGLLIRRMIRYRTIFGALPVEADYSDYRDVNGVKIPYKTTWFTAGESSTYTIKDVKDNVPVDDSKFEPPAKQ